MTAPTAFGRYLLLDRIAYGGMAEVFRAKQFGDEGFDRIIAIKRVLPSVADDEQFVAMFRDEAQITRTLQHGNIAQVYDFGVLDGSYFLAMEYISGIDLRTLFRACEKAGKPMGPQVASLIVKEVAEGLGYAHRATDLTGSSLGLIHRDVSPQNILLSWAGEVKLVDFGIAKARQKSQRTDAGVLKGKFGYMSPEQVRGLPLSNRSDIFSLGIVFWELLTGHRAFDRETDYATMDAVRAVDLASFEETNPNIPKNLQTICMKALAKDEEERFRFCELLARELGRWGSRSADEVGAYELSKLLKETFPQAYAEERQRLISYEGLSKERMSEVIRGPAPQVRSPAIQVEVSQLAPVMQLRSITVSDGQARTPSAIRTPEPPARLPQVDSGKRLALLVILLAITATAAAGWTGWSWWASRPGSLMVSTLPVRVTVIVDNERLGETEPAPDGRGSLVVEIPHGLVNVRLEADGFGALVEDVLIRPGKTFAWQPDLTEVVLNDGEVRLAITPPEATVLLNLETIVLAEGRASFRLASGAKGTISVQANNYLPAHRTIGPLRPGSITEMAITLTLERWTLVIKPTPADAVVTLRIGARKRQRGKGEQTAHGLGLGTSVVVEVGKKGCRRVRRVVRSSTESQTVVPIKLRCR